MNTSPSLSASAAAPPAATTRRSAARGVLRMKPLTPVAPSTRIVLGIAFFVLFVAVWAAVTLGGLVPKQFLASPLQMLASGWTLLVEFDFLHDIGMTVWRVVGGFLIGWITGERGMTMIGPFVRDPFNGVLCLFLLDMGLLAARQASALRMLKPPVLAFGIVMPLIGAAIGFATAALIGLSLGGTILMMVLAASASYIAVPAAMRMALPEANPAVYVTLSLAVTFPFNVVVGIPLYAWIATAAATP